MAKSTKVKAAKETVKVSNTPATVTKKDIEEVSNTVFDDKKVFDNVDNTIKFIEPLKVVEDKKDEQKILDYVANSHSETIDLAPLIKSLYPVALFAEPAKYLQQQESKKIKNLISKLKSGGSLVLENDSYLKLGSSYWHDGDIKTKHHTIDTVKIIAKK